MCCSVGYVSIIQRVHVLEVTYSNTPELEVTYSNTPEFWCKFVNAEPFWDE